jgi:hypothetical protein
MGAHDPVEIIIQVYAAADAHLTGGLLATARRQHTFPRAGRAKLSAQPQDLSSYLPSIGPARPSGGL